MPEMMLRVGVDQAREHVVLELWKEGQPLGHINLDGATAEKHTRDVAVARASLADPVTPDLDIGARLEAVHDPAWRIPGERLEQGRVLVLRHPGLGWLSFVLPDKEATLMSEWLTKDLPVQPKAK